jgi:hypothetical protein
MGNAYGKIIIDSTDKEERELTISNYMEAIYSEKDVSQLNKMSSHITSITLPWKFSELDTAKEELPAAVAAAAAAGATTMSTSAPTASMSLPPPLHVTRAPPAPAPAPPAVPSPSPPPRLPSSRPPSLLRPLAPSVPLVGRSPPPIAGSAPTPPLADPSTCTIPTKIDLPKLRDYVDKLPSGNLIKNTLTTLVSGTVNFRTLKEGMQIACEQHGFIPSNYALDPASERGGGRDRRGGGTGGRGGGTGGRGGWRGGRGGAVRTHHDEVLIGGARQTYRNRPIPERQSYRKKYVRGNLTRKNHRPREEE